MTNPALLASLNMIAQWLRMAEMDAEEEAYIIEQAMQRLNDYSRRMRAQRDALKKILLRPDSWEEIYDIATAALALIDAAGEEEPA